MKLTDTLPQTVTVHNITFEIDYAFDNILLFRDMLADDDLTDHEKVEIGLEMLVKNYKDVKRLQDEQQIELFLTIFDTLQEQQDDEEAQGVGKKTYDFDQDAELIYASFLMDYNLDLFDNRIHWKKFIALLNGLSDRTPFMKVLDIRTRPMPKPTKYNTDERKQLQKLKRKYAIEQSEEQLNESMSQAANFLRQKAGGKHG